MRAIGLCRLSVCGVLDGVWRKGESKSFSPMNLCTPHGFFRPSGPGVRSSASLAGSTALLDSFILLANMVPTGLSRSFLDVKQSMPNKSHSTKP